MSIANKIFQNTLWQVIIRALNIFIGVLSLALITRILGQAGFGYYTTAFAFVQMFMILVDLGLYLTLLREISAAKERKDENRIVNNIFTIRIVSAVLVLILIPLVVQFFPYTKEVKIGVTIFMFCYFFQSIISTLTAVFSKNLAMPKVAITDLVNKTLYALALIYLFKTSGNLNQILFFNVITQGTAFILLLVFLKKYVSLQLAWDFVYWKQVFHRTWPLAITVVLNLVYFKADTLILSAYHSPEDVAIYGAPYRVLEVLSTFPHMFMSLILPIFTAAWVTQNKEKLKNSLQHSFDFFSIISVAMIFVTWLISSPLMTLLAGQEFVKSGPILNILIIATAAIFFGTLFTYLVVALNLQKQMVKYFLITAGIGILGYFTLIPRFSYWGAAYMTLLVEILIVVFAFVVVKKNVSLNLNFKVLIKSIIAAVIASFVASLLEDKNIILVTILAGLIYILVLFFTKAINQSLIKEIFNKK
ncbi:flippase [Patescibacteria group bacterium]|nr:flippase [Patescibacteria group bacterium]